MMYNRIVLSCILIALLMISCGPASDKQAVDTSLKTDEYELVHDWPDLPEDMVLGMVTGLGIDSDNNLVIFHRAGQPWAYPPPENKIDRNTILTIDTESGKVLKNWGSNLFYMPHGLEVDQENNVWITDVGLQQIVKFNADGEYLMALGEEKVVGNDSAHFALPTDLVVAPDGSYYISDGYGNSRVLQFSPDNTFLLEWGKNGPDRNKNRGKEHGVFDIPHGIDMDRNGNVYVADRENNRIQKFDGQGNFITSWQNNAAHQLYSVAFDHENSRLFAIDYDSISVSSTIFRFDPDLNLQTQFKASGSGSDTETRYHDIAIDQNGNVYVGDIKGNRVQKFRLKNPE